MADSYESKYMVRFEDYKGQVQYINPTNIHGIGPVIQDSFIASWPKVNGVYYVGALSKIDIDNEAKSDHYSILVKGTVADTIKRVDAALDVVAKGGASTPQTETPSAPSTVAAPAGSDIAKKPYRSRHFLRLPSESGYPLWLRPQDIVQIWPIPSMENDADGNPVDSGLVRVLLSPSWWMVEYGSLNADGVRQGTLADVLRAIDVHIAARLGQSFDSGMNEVKADDGEPFKLPPTSPAPAGENEN